MFAHSLRNIGLVFVACTTFNLVVSIPTSGQTIESWEVLSALDRTTAVAALEDGGALIGTTGGAYRIDASNAIVDTWRSNGELLRLDVSAVGEDPSTGDLYFGAADGSVSIYRAGGWWTYVLDIRAAGRADAGITGFRFAGDRAYIMTRFGVAEFSTGDSTIRDSWTRFGGIAEGTPVNGLHLSADSIFVATNRGLAIASRAAANLTDPTSWRVVPANASGCGAAPTSLAIVGGTLFVGDAEGICRYEAGQLVDIDTSLVGPILTSGTSNGTAIVDRSIYPLEPSGALGTNVEMPTSIASATTLADVSILVGLESGGAVRSPESNPIAILPDGPGSNRFEDLDIGADGDLWGATGTEGVVRFDGTEWYHYLPITHPNLTTTSAQSIGRDAQGGVWSGSFGDGFFRFSSDTEKQNPSIVNFDETNSSLRASGAGATFVIATGVVFDQSGVLWLLNWDNTTASRVGLHAYDYGQSEVEGTWHPFAFSGPTVSFTREFRDIVVDLDGTKWIGGDGQQGLVYYVDGESLEQTGSWGVLRTSSGLLSNDQTALLVDTDGELWVGTPSGISILVNPFSVARNGAGAAIFREVRALDNVLVRDIAADPLNRKWIATDEGIFVLSADGTELLARFQSASSALSDDAVLSIAVDGANGLLYFGTANGLNRVRTEAVASTVAATIAASPQPFRPAVDRQIRFTGLPSRATLKILTTAGHLVAEIVAPGGDVAYWDGRGTDGEPVSTGVYVVSASSKDGPAVTGKIAIVQP